MLVHQEVNLALSLPVLILHTCVEGGTVRFKHRTQEHNTMSFARACMWTTLSRDKRYNQDPFVNNLQGLLIQMALSAHGTIYLSSNCSKYGQNNTQNKQNNYREILCSDFHSQKHNNRLAHLIQNIHSPSC